MTNQKPDPKTLLDKTDIDLEIGGGNEPMAGFVNIDILDLPKVDIVWDLETTPWPLSDDCCRQVVAIHVLEHISPHKGIFINVMDEIWRVLKPGGRFRFVVPHGKSDGYIQDPTHVNMINETTMHYFDPSPDPKIIGAQDYCDNFYKYYRPKPWKIIDQNIDPQYFNLEVVIEKRPWDDKYLTSWTRPTN